MAEGDTVLCTFGVVLFLTHLLITHGHLCQDSYALYTGVFRAIINDKTSTAGSSKPSS